MKLLPESKTMRKPFTRVGLTFDLRDEYLAAGYGHEETAELDKIETIEGIEQALTRLGFHVERVGSARKLVERLAHGDTWDLVFNIAEGLHGRGREALVPALLDAYRIPYVFSDPLVMTCTLDKAVAKTLVAAAGLSTAPFTLVREIRDLRKVNLSYPLFLKPVGEGTGKGVSSMSRVGTKSELARVGSDLLRRYRQPVLVETFLPGREFTVGIVGQGPEAEVLGGMEVRIAAPSDCSAIYSYETKADYENRVRYQPANDAVAHHASDLALQCWRVLGCRDGGRVDIRCDADGNPAFIEVNPLAGLNPKDSDLPILCRLNGIGFEELIARIMDHAMRRIRREAPRNAGRKRPS